MDKELKMKEWKVAFSKAKLDYSVTEEKCMIWLKLSVPYTVEVKDEDVNQAVLDDMVMIFDDMDGLYNFFNVLNRYFNVLELTGKFETRVQDKFQFLRNEVSLTPKNNPDFFETKFNMKFLEGLDHLKSLSKDYES